MMRMEVLPSDRESLEKLLDAFGSVVSLDDIALAYCQSGRDLYTASEILSDLHSSASLASSSTAGEERESADMSPSDDSLEKANHVKSNSRKAPASMGTIGGVIGRDYLRTRPSTNKLPKSRPLKLNSDDIPISEIWDWDEKDSDSIRKGETMRKDIEEFLFKMLGDGFHLEKHVIQDIVGQCGYDINKSVEKLLNFSASTFEKSDDILNITPEIPTKNYHDLECKQQHDQFPNTGSSGSCISAAKYELALPYSNKEEKHDLHKDSLGTMFAVPERSKEQERSCPVKQAWKSRALGQPVNEPIKETIIKYRPVIRNPSPLTNGKEVSDLQKEVLGALFTVSERSKKEPEKRRPIKEVRRPRAFGQPVEEPLKETIIEHRPIITRKQIIKNDEEENGDEYEILRKAVTEYCCTMKEYYKSAVEAFTKGDHERAEKLLEEGHFFMKKAREADEKSAQKLLERNDEEEMFVDVHDFEPKEAVRYLKFQLLNLSGISSFKHLKVLAGSNDEDKNHGRRRDMIIKLLDREDINWAQEGDGWIIVIPLAEMDPKKLSFAKK